MLRSNVVVGIVGPGAIGDLHARALAKIGVRCLAIAGPNKEQRGSFAARHGIERVYDSAVSLMSDGDIEAVVIATPNDLHSGQTRLALEAGKHVLCEVPMAMSFAAGLEVCEAQQKAGRIAAVAHTTLFLPAHQMLSRRLALSKSTVTHVIGRSIGFRHENIGWTGQSRDWVDNVLWHGGSHLVYDALSFLGTEEVTVSAAFGPQWGCQKEPMDVAAVLQTSDSRIASLSLSFHSRVSANGLVVISPDESFEIDGGRLTGAEGVLGDWGGENSLADGVIAQDRDFIDAIQYMGHPGVPTSVALKTLRVLQDIEDRARVG